MSRDKISVLLFGCTMTKYTVETEIAYFHTGISQLTQEVINEEKPSQFTLLQLPSDCLNLRRPVMLLNFELDRAR